MQDLPKANIKLSESEAAISTLYNLNNQIETTIVGIENKCHALLNRQSPEDKANEVAPEPNDFFSSLRCQTNRLATISLRLDRIYKHLSEIS